MNEELTATQKLFESMSELIPTFDFKVNLTITNIDSGEVVNSTFITSKTNTTHVFCTLLPINAYNLLHQLQYTADRIRRCGGKNEPISHYYGDEKC